MADFSTLISDVYKLLETTNIVLNPSINHEVRVEKPSLRMSNLGQPLRKLYYDLTGSQPERVSGQTLLKFDYGHLIEALFVQLANAAGHEVTDQQLEVKLDNCLGHIDGGIDSVLVDVKSCSPASFEKFKSGKILTDDPFSYIYQLSGYWSCLPQYERAAFIAINKVSGEIFAFELPQEHKTSLEELQSKIKKTREVVSTNTLPERCYEDVADGKSGNRKLSVGCSYCGHKFGCWSDSNNGDGLQTFYYSTGPRYLTKVMRQPKVEQEELQAFKVKQ